MKTSRRILLASYYFPPDAAVGGLRVAKFARVLRTFGCEPQVLTVRGDLLLDGVDESRLDGLDGVPVTRTGELPRAVEAVGRMRSALRRRPRHSGQSVPIASAGGRETLERRLTRYALSLLWHLPDDKKNWSVRAAARSVSLIRRERIDWVFTSGPPFSCHVIGLAAKMFTGARWVADFRDPWIDMLPEREASSRSEVSDRLERWMERAVARRADRIVTTTKQMRDAMSVRYPELQAEKFVSIPNSIDTDRMPAVPHIEPYSTFTITYAGSLYFDRTPEPLFRAIAALVSSGRTSRHDIRLKLVGNCRYVDGIETRAIADRYGLGDIVEVIDRVPYSEAVRIMQRSHLLLMLAPERHRLVVPAKIFDYLGSRTPILAIAEPGATADFMAETQCGRCFTAGDIQGLVAYLESVLKNGTLSELKNDPARFSRYDVKHLTGQLVAEMANAEAESFEAVVART